MVHMWGRQGYMQSAREEGLSNDYVCLPRLWPQQRQKLEPRTLHSQMRMLEQPPVEKTTVE